MAMYWKQNVLKKNTISFLTIREYRIFDLATDSRPLI